MAAEQEDRVTGGGRSITVAVTALAIVVGVTLRLWFLMTPQGRMDGDEALAGVMVQHILRGHQYTFVAGQLYNGSDEQYLQAALALVVPVTQFTLRLVEVALWVVTAVLVAVTTRRLTGSATRAAIATWLLALGPYFAVWRSIRAHGSYAGTELVGVLAILTVIRLRSTGRGAVLLGLCCGFTLWAAWTTAYLVLPAVLYALPVLVRRWRTAAAWLGGLVVGCLPALIWSLDRSRLPGLSAEKSHNTPLQRLYNLVHYTFGEFSGMTYYNGHGGAPYLVLPVLLLLGGVWLGACWTMRQDWRALVTMRPGPVDPRVMLLAVVPVVIVAYAASKYTWYVGEPRYLFAATPALPMGVACVVSWPGRSVRRLAGAACGLVAATGSVLSIGLLAEHSGHSPGYSVACLRQVTDYLVAHHETAVYSDYWSGMPLQMEAGRSLSVGPRTTGRTRFPELRERADASPSPVYVEGHIPDSMGEDSDQVTVVDNALKKHGVQAQRHGVSCMVVWDHLSRPLGPIALGIGVPLTHADLRNS